MARIVKSRTCRILLVIPDFRVWNTSKAALQGEGYSVGSVMVTLEGRRVPFQHLKFHFFSASWKKRVAPTFLLCQYLVEGEVCELWEEGV